MQARPACLTGVLGVRATPRTTDLTPRTRARCAETGPESEATGRHNRTALSLRATAVVIASTTACTSWLSVRHLTFGTRLNGSSVVQQNATLLSHNAILLISSQKKSSAHPSSWGWLCVLNSIISRHTKQKKNTTTSSVLRICGSAMTWFVKIIIYRPINLLVYRYLLPSSSIVATADKKTLTAAFNETNPSWLCFPLRGFLSARKVHSWSLNSPCQIVTTSGLLERTANAHTVRQNRATKQKKNKFFGIFGTIRSALPWGEQ